MVSLDLGGCDYCTGANRFGLEYMYDLAHQQSQPGRDSRNWISNGGNRQKAISNRQYTYVCMYQHDIV